MKGMTVGRVLICILLASVLAFAFALPVSANGATNWYLDSVDHSVAGKIMEMTRGGQSGAVPILSGQTLFWLADQAAAHDVTFSSGAWVIGLTTDANWGGNISSGPTVTVVTSSSPALMVLGEWVTSNSTFMPFSTSTQSKLTWNSGQNIMSVELQNGPVTVHQGNYLTLAVTNQDSTSHIVITDGSSFVESPTSNPGYPLPEASTLVLFGIGVAGLLGYVGIKRFKSATKA